MVGAYYASEVLRALDVGRVRQQIFNAEKLLDWLNEQPESKIGLAAIYQFGPPCVRLKMPPWKRSLYSNTMAG